jgi:hypothetical protein
MYDASMMKIGLYLNNVVARNHDRLSRINHDKKLKAKHDHEFAVNKHA